ncbi:hypothetical protein FQZ97_1165080 [compost metagenome]
MTDDQHAVVAGLNLRQALGVLRQLITTGRQQFGGHDFLAQRRLEEGQCRLRISKGFAQLRFGALVHGLRGKALIAVIHQRLKHGGRQAVLVTLLSG